jgi:hypothetical protein
VDNGGKGRLVFASVVRDSRFAFAGRDRKELCNFGSLLHLGSWTLSQIGQQMNSRIFLEWSLNLWSKISQRLKGEGSSEIQILALIRWEHLLCTKFVILVTYEKFVHTITYPPPAALVYLTFVCMGISRMLLEFRVPFTSQRMVVYLQELSSSESIGLAVFICTRCSQLKVVDRVVT